MISLKIGVIWDFAGKFTSFFSRLLISILLTKLLSPSDYGLFGAVFVFVNLLQGFVDIGFGAGLIQYKKTNDNDYSTIFWVNVAISLIIFSVLFIVSPLIGSYYNNPDLESITKWLSVIVLLSGLRKVHEVRNQKLMNFKLSSTLNVLASICSGIIAIYYASRNSSVWALIIYEIAYSLFLTFGFWIFSNWRPRFYFRRNNINNILGFSKKYFITAVINLLFARIDYIIIAKFFPIEYLGNYLRAKSFSQYIRTFSSVSLANVLFPYFSKIQLDKEDTERVFIKAIGTVTLMSVYLSGVLFLTSIELFTILFNREWLISAQYFKLLSITGYVAPISTIMVNLILGQGLSGLYLKTEILKRLIYIPGLIIAYLFGILSYLYFFIVFEIIVLIINSVMTSRVLKTSNLRILKLFFPTILIGIGAALIIDIISEFENPYISILLKGVIFTIVYVIFVIYFIKDNKQLMAFYVESFRKKFKI